MTAAESATTPVRAQAYPGLNGSEVMFVVNAYIGGSDGYLGDFSYRTHAEFYPTYCDLEIDPYRYEGTTRDRFIAILKSLAPLDQAKVLRGLLARFPRDDRLQGKLQHLIRRLESGASLIDHEPQVTSAAVRQALRDADTLLRSPSSGPTSAVDRVHTALHAYLRAICSEEGTLHEDGASTTALLKALRTHPALSQLGPRGQDIQKVLNAFGAILDALNPIRNLASIAHPNEALLDEPEARLVINAASAVLSYLDARLEQSRGGTVRAETTMGREVSGNGTQKPSSE